MTLTSALAQFDTKARESLFSNVRSFYAKNLNASVSSLQEAIVGKGDATLTNEHAIYTALSKVEEDLSSIFHHSNQLYASILSSESVPIPAISQALALLLATARLQPTFSQMTWRSTTILKTLSIMRLINAVPQWAKHLNERFKVSSAPEMIMSANEGLQTLDNAANQFLSDTSKYPPPPLLMNLLTREQQNGDPSELLSACKSMAEIIVKANDEIQILYEAAKEEAVTADRVAFQADQIALADIEAAAKERLKALEEKSKPPPTRDIFSKPENVMQVLDAPRRPSMDAAPPGVRSNYNEFIEEEEFMGQNNQPLPSRKSADQKSHRNLLPDSRSPLSSPNNRGAMQRHSVMSNPYGEGELDVERGPAGRVDRSFDLMSGSIDAKRDSEGGGRGQGSQSHDRWPNLMGGGAAAAGRRASASPPRQPYPQPHHMPDSYDQAAAPIQRRMTHDVAPSNNHRPSQASTLSPPPPAQRPASTLPIARVNASSRVKSSKKKEEPAFVDTPLPPGIRPRLLSHDLKMTGAALTIVTKREKEREDRRRVEEEAERLAAKNGWKRAGDKAQFVPPAVPLAVMEVRLQVSVIQQLQLMETIKIQQQQQLGEVGGGVGGGGGGLLVPSHPSHPPHQALPQSASGGKLIPQQHQQQQMQPPLQGGRLVPSVLPPPAVQQPSLGGGGGGRLVPSVPPLPAANNQPQQKYPSVAPSFGLSSYGTLSSSSSHNLPVHNAYQAPTIESLTRPSPPPPPPAPQQLQPRPQSQSQVAAQPQSQVASQPQPQVAPPAITHAISTPPPPPSIPAPTPTAPPPAPTSQFIPPSKPTHAKSRMSQIQSQAASNSDEVYKAVAHQLKADAKVNQHPNVPQAVILSTATPTAVMATAPTVVMSAAPTAVMATAPTAVMSAAPTAVMSTASTPVMSAAPTAVMSAAPTAVMATAPTAVMATAPKTVVLAAPTAVASSSHSLPPAPPATTNLAPILSPPQASSSPPTAAPSKAPSSAPAPPPAAAPPLDHSSAPTAPPLASSSAPPPSFTDAASPPPPVPPSAPPPAYASAPPPSFTAAAPPAAAAAPPADTASATSLRIPAISSADSF